MLLIFYNTKSDKMSDYVRIILYFCKVDKILIKKQRFIMAVETDTDISIILKELSSLWGNLSEEQTELLKASISIHQYQKNEIIYKRHEMPRAAMYLLSGKIKILKEGIGGKYQIVRVIRPIEIFGYRAFFAGEEHKTSALAFEQSTIAQIPFGIIKQLIKESSQTAMFFIRQLSIELGYSDNRIVSLTQKHIRARLAEALLFLKESYGLEDDGYTLSIYLSREDLASLSNMTTSNAIRTLSTFANEGLITIDGRKIKLINMDELHKISMLG